MKLLKNTKILYPLLSVLLLIPWLYPANSYATDTLLGDRVDPTHPIEINVLYQAVKDTEGATTTPLAGAEFQLFAVATADEYGKLSATAAFVDYFVDIRGQNDTAWRAQATTLEGLAQRDKIAPVDSGKTNSSGELSFVDNKLTPGLYLLCGSRHTQDGYYFDAAPSLILLPTMDKESNSLQYAVTVYPKYEQSTVPESGGGKNTVKRKALKIWQDSGHEESRPSEVTVQLLCNGEIYDTVTLTADQNWRYTWENLSSKYRWTLVEKAVEGYTGTVTQSGVTFEITNTYSTPPGGNTPPQEDTPPGGNTPPQEDTPPADNPPTDTTTPGTSIIATDVATNVATLPKTGQLWWPVPIMLCFGLAFLLLNRSLGGKHNGR